MGRRLWSWRGGWWAKMSGASFFGARRCLYYEAFFPKEIRQPGVGEARSFNFWGWRSGERRGGMGFRTR